MNPHSMSFRLAKSYPVQTGKQSGLSKPLAIKPTMLCPYSQQMKCHLTNHTISIIIKPVTNQCPESPITKYKLIIYHYSMPKSIPNGLTPEN